MDSNSGKPIVKSLCESCELQTKFVFRHLNAKQLRCLSKEIEEFHYMPGELIFKQGTSPQGFICLRKGKVKIILTSSNGNTQIIDLKSSPDTIGIRALSTNSRYQSSAMALDQVNICLIPIIVFQELLDSNPKVLRELLNYLGDRLVRADQKIISLSQKHVKSRLADTLLHLNQNIGEDPDGYIDIPLKRFELAQLSNMTTANAIRTLSEFKNRGLVHLKGRKIKIVDKEFLTKISEFDKY